MIRSLKFLFGGIFVFMVWMTVSTSLKSSLFADLPRLLRDPWTVATLWDAYFGFITFFVWVAYKERTAAARAGWLALILLLGNIAMSFYVLLQLFRLPPDATVEDLLLEEEKYQ
jgi:hypothetical protein